MICACKFTHRVPDFHGWSEAATKRTPFVTENHLRGTTGRYTDAVTGVIDELPNCSYDCSMAERGVCKL